MRPIAEATSRVAGQNFKRKYIALGRIVNAWHEIVGKDLSTKAQPMKLRYRKREKDKKPEAALDIAVSGSDATLLHYQKDLILERINQIFGERWVTAIRFVQTPVNTASLKPRKAKTPLTSEEKNTLSDMLGSISDLDIREKLSSLGQEILIESKS